MSHDIVWVASYPKSGNTWLRFLVYFLLHRNLSENSRDIDAFINSDLNDLGRSDGLAVKKTHASLDALGAYHKQTCAAAYIHRHPLDTLCSAMNYEILTARPDIAAAPPPERDAWRRHYVDGYLSHAGQEAWIASGRNYGTWTGNVAGWTQGGAPFPILVLRYEDLLEAPSGQIARLARFLVENGVLDQDAGTQAVLVEAALAATGFDRLRAFEDREIASANAAGAALGRFSGESRRQAAAHGVRFFNKGQTGQYHDLLTLAEIARGRDVFGALAARLGYEI